MPQVAAPECANQRTRRRHSECTPWRWREARLKTYSTIANCIPHRFRHSFGTELLRKTNDVRTVQEALGHADIGSTIGYTALADDRLAKAIGTLAWGDQ